MASPRRQNESFLGGGPPGGLSGAWGPGEGGNPVQAPGQGAVCGLVQLGWHSGTGQQSDSWWRQSSFMPPASLNIL